MVYARVFYIVWNDGTKETFYNILERNHRMNALEDQGYERDLDFTTYSDLIPEEDLYC
jgi:hypothetical protein